MFDLFFSKTHKKLERLILATKAELMEKIGELSATVSGEAGQVRSAIESLESVVLGLNEKVAALELAVGSEADFTAELETLAKVKSDIEGIYSPVV